MTPYLYRRPERYVLANLRNGHSLGALRWTVDTETDLQRVRAIVRYLEEQSISWPDASWSEILDVAGAEPPRVAPGTLALRPATMSDAERVLEWRNDADSVRWSTTGVSVERAAHDRWFAAVLDDPGRRMLIAELDGRAVGSVRVDVVDGIGVVSIAVAPQSRGQGYGQAMLRALGESLIGDCQVRELEAIVHRDNARSLQAFAATGFAAVDDRPDGMRVLRRAS